MAGCLAVSIHLSSQLHLCLHGSISSRAAAAAAAAAAALALLRASRGIVSSQCAKHATEKRRKTCNKEDKKTMCRRNTGDSASRDRALLSASSSTAPALWPPVKQSQLHACLLSTLPGDMWAAECVQPTKIKKPTPSVKVLRSFGIWDCKASLQPRSRFAPSKAQSPAELQPGARGSRPCSKSPGDESGERTRKNSLYNQKRKQTERERARHRVRVRVRFRHGEGWGFTTREAGNGEKGKQWEAFGLRQAAEQEVRFAIAQPVNSAPAMVPGSCATTKSINQVHKAKKNKRWKQVLDGEAGQQGKTHSRTTIG